MWDNVMISLTIMAEGMAGIFTAILIIMAFVWLMSRLGRRNQPDGPEK